MNLMQNFVEKNMPEKAAPTSPWATPSVSTCGSRKATGERIQVFEGTVIAKKHGGINETFTVRRISYGVGVEKVFPLYSPVIEKVETVRKGKVQPGQAVLSPRPRGQGSQGQGKAVISARVQKGSAGAPFFGKAFSGQEISCILS